MLEMAVSVVNTDLTCMFISSKFSSFKLLHNDQAIHQADIEDDISADVDRKTFQKREIFSRVTLASSHK